MTTGRLVLHKGPMFAGKTERLIELAEFYSRSQRVAVILPQRDDRHGVGEVVSHGGSRLDSAFVDKLVGESPGHLIASAVTRGCSVILVDETQFFHASLAFVARRAASAGQIVVVSGLDYDSEGSEFETISAVDRVADEVTTFRGKCAVCSGLSSRTRRLPSAGKERVLVGGADLYSPRCRSCFDLGK